MVRQAEKVQTVVVVEASDVDAARQAAKSLADALGFRAEDAGKIALAAGELASNLVRHAGGGTLALRPLEEGGRIGLQVESIDDGPGIPDVARAMGGDRTGPGGPGSGLGTVNRVMDEFDLSRRAGGGTRIVCRRWRPPEIPLLSPCPLSFGTASRPRLGETDNGDAFVLVRWGRSALAGVIDGTGHGPAAHAASEAARMYVENHCDRPLGEIFRGTDFACRPTHGVAMALARFEFPEPGAGEGSGASAIRLEFAGIGDAAGRIFGPREEAGFHVGYGVLGVNASEPVVVRRSWAPGSILVLHSDGIPSGWRLADFPGLEARTAPEIAWRLLDRLGRDDEDAAVVVVRSAPGVNAGDGAGRRRNGEVPP